MNVPYLLNHGLDVLQRSGSHTRGALARDAQGHKVAPNSPYAVCWCAYGLLLKGAGAATFVTDGDADRASRLLHKAAVEGGFVSAPRRNDSEGKAGAVAMYKRALVLFEQRLPTRARTTEGSTK